MSYTNKITLRLKIGAPTSPGPKAKLDLSIFVGKSLFPNENSSLCAMPKVGLTRNSSAQVIPTRNPWC